MKLTDAQLAAMLKMQESMNSKIDPNWRDRNNAWYRAAWVECGELMDHVGWKWWKKQMPCGPQIDLELVDLWHFGLSDVLQHSPATTAISSIQNLLSGNPSPNAVSQERQLRIVEEFAETTLREKRFPIRKFVELASAFGFSGDSLYRGYIGKNVLNRFRQDHGYREGTYEKIWQGREDNEHLTEIVTDIDPMAIEFEDVVYRELSQRYLTSK
ncbi:Dimeric dUTPase, all-alpha-NTP-PPase (MazG) superfamily [Polaromonas sp. YR568]|uniref:dUTP diphosphatase n=1 Tax=Polaromonas sp. YR568 TaxID=1855301 RepID=UPI0008E2B013|nr:dUTP diphosphatase [Polaromonas sp. YR568]SFU92891.1 Dimeric dUTPase, all-alpha-NTP-PPase (MazG) superfamily [Polaromonas sp. YR568]